MSQMSEPINLSLPPSSEEPSPTGTEPEKLILEDEPLIDVVNVVDQFPKLEPIPELEPEPVHVEPSAEPIMPSLADMPLHEWVAALTHPITGEYKNGITTRTMDNLVKQLGVTEFPSHDRGRYLSMWKTPGHFAVHLSEAARKGRIRRIQLGTYMGVFGKNIEQDKPRPLKPRVEKILDTATTDPYQGEQRLPARTVPSSSSKRKSFFPQRRPYLTKRVCPTSDKPSDEMFVVTTKSSADRPPSCDSISGGSGSSTDGGTVPFQRKRGRRPKRENTGTSLAPRSKEGQSEQRELTDEPSPPKLSPKVPRMSGLVSSVVCKGADSRNAGIEDINVPSLNVEPSMQTATIDSVSSLTSKDVYDLCSKFGLKQEANMLHHEEIDGVALLLLTRHDVMNHLGLKLGPALKLYRFIDGIQRRAKKNSTNHAASDM